MADLSPELQDIIRQVRQYATSAPGTQTAAQGRALGEVMNTVAGVQTSQLNEAGALERSKMGIGSAEKIAQANRVIDQQNANTNQDRLGMEKKVYFDPISPEASAALGIGKSPLISEQKKIEPQQPGAWWTRPEMGSLRKLFNN